MGTCAAAKKQGPKKPERDLELQIAEEEKLQIADSEYLKTQETWYLHGDTSNKSSVLLVEQFLKFYSNYAIYQKYYAKNFEGIKLDPNPPAKVNNDSSPPDNSLFKMRYIVRKGCNVGLIPTLIKNKFRVDWNSYQQKYDLIKSVVFEKCSQQNMRIVPTFSELSLPELLEIHCLTLEGQIILKRILWVIKENFHLLEYNPMITQIAAISLLFLSESQTYLLITSMMEESAAKLNESKKTNSSVMKDLRWNARLFFDVASSRSRPFNKIIEKLSQLGFDYTKQFVVWTSHFFTNVLSFRTVLRLYMIYLNEGIRVIYKIAFGIWMTLSEKIQNCQTKEDVEKILKTCSIDKKIEETNRLFVFEAIWEWIPSSYKITNPDLIYSTFNDGFSYLTLLSRAAANNSHPMLLVIKTNKGKVFGVFSEVMIETGKLENYFGSDEIFLFTLEPNEEVFYPTSNNKNYICCQRSELSFGTGENGPALLVNKDLKGQSNLNDTFSNKPLHGDETNKQFNITNIELYALCP